MGRRWLAAACAAGIVGMLASCAVGPVGPSPTAPPVVHPPAVQVPLEPVDVLSLPVLTLPKSRWVPVRWSELPGLEADALHEAWNAWLKSCERPVPAFAALCGEVRLMSLSTAEEQRAWMVAQLQPYRVEALDGPSEGLLTAYFEPVLEASRVRQGAFQIPLYKAPPDLATRKPWYTREEMETLPQARAALQGQEIAWVADPVEALILQIQGSGRLRITEPDGQQRMVRLAYAATNDRPYASVGRWLLDRGLVRDATWPGIQAWLAQNPQRTTELMWSNPRVVFFREEPLGDFEANLGPRGAQGVALTPGRSIAVDRGSIPYGTPVWLASPGPQTPLQRLVLAQDTGSAIVGAVRADYFVGWGPQAGDLAGRLKQSLRLWALWPRQAGAPR